MEVTVSLAVLIPARRWRTNYSTYCPCDRLRRTNFPRYFFDEGRRAYNVLANRSSRRNAGMLFPQFRQGPCRGVNSTSFVRMSSSSQLKRFSNSLNSSKITLLFGTRNNIIIEPWLSEGILLGP